MASFCKKCGASLSGGPFCVKCGADMRGTAPQVQAQPSTPPVSSSPGQPAPTPAAANNSKKMSPLAKAGIAAIVIIFVGGALAIVGVFYAAHRVSQKIHEEAGSLIGSSSSASDSSSGGNSDSANKNMGDVCRLLSKEDVSKAIGIEIVGTKSEDNACSYLARGNSADMTAKHMAAIAGTKGADARAQKMTEQIAGGLFKSLQAQQGDSGQDSSGNVPVLIFSIDPNSAEAQMRLNGKVLGNLGPGPEGLSGIGDQAFDMGGAMIMIRKGDKLVRIMYSMCPCSVEAIKPLAKEIADAL